MKQKNYFLVLAIILMLPFVSCQKEHANIDALCSGTWYMRQNLYVGEMFYEWTFKSNGTFSYREEYHDFRGAYPEPRISSGTGAYRLSGKNLYLALALEEYTIESKVLSLTDEALEIEVYDDEGRPEQWVFSH